MFNNLCLPKLADDPFNLYGDATTLLEKTWDI